MLHVPYRGLAAGGYADLMTGAVHATFDNLPPSIELIRAGKLRARDNLNDALAGHAGASDRGGFPTGL